VRRFVWGRAHNEMVASVRAPARVWARAKCACHQAAGGRRGAHTTARKQGGIKQNTIGKVGFTQSPAG
jgi:hypothetical protein